MVLIAATPNVLVVHPSLPVKNVQEFVAFAKARRNQVNYASTGLGAADGTTESFDDYFRAEVVKLREVIIASGVKAE